MERLDAYASQRHFADHIAPLWHALDDQLRGDFLVDRRLARYVERLGISAKPATTATLHGRHRTPILVAAIGDLRRAGRRPAVFMEHGAGQTYRTKNASYAGGDRRRTVELFLNPSERVAGLNRLAWPRARQATIGCPKLDRYAGRRWPAPGSRPVVAIAFHWHCRVEPETYGALSYYQAGLDELRDSGFEILGHGHPRLWDDDRAQLERIYRDAGIEPVQSFAEILERADLLAADNTSALYEFAATGRPVAVLNAPWYRREVEHGLRFWEYADVGVQIDGPDELVDGITAALRDTATRRRRRAMISAELYANLDGGASRAGAAAITDWLEARAERMAA